MSKASIVLYNAQRLQQYNPDRSFEECLDMAEDDYYTMLSDSDEDEYFEDSED